MAQQNKKTPTVQAGLPIPRNAFAVAWEAINGTVPTNHTIKSFCKNKHCFRPIHHYSHPIAGYQFLLDSLESSKGDDRSLPWNTYSCSLWPLTPTNIYPYPSIKLPDGTIRSVHIVAYELAVGPINGLFVLHACDTPNCHRPSHLFLGTQWDNIHDCISKGRNPHGERQRSAIFTEDDIREIRKLYTEGMKQMDIVRKFSHKSSVGLKGSTIWAIVHRQTWTHVAD